MRQLLTAEPRGFRGLSAMRQKAPELRSLNAARGDRGNSLRPSTPPGTHSSLTSSYSQTSCAYSQSLIAALSSAPTADFALHGELLSLVWPRESNQREDHPGIRPRLRRGSLLPALLRGPSRWDVLSHRSSLGVLPHVPLRNTSTRPTDGDSGSEVLGSPSRCCALLIVPTQSVGTIGKGIQNFQATPNAPLQEAERNHCGRG